jgi:transcription antitermination factor NusG
VSSNNDISGWNQTIQIPAEQAIPDGMPGQWWVAHTKPRNEKSLAADFRAHRIYCYLPLCRRVTRSNNTGRISRSLVPLFPGYLFFNGNEEQRYRALTTNRIANVLVVSNQQELIGQLRQIHHVLASGTDFQWNATIRAGDWARVIAGPLAGVEGVVCRSLSRSRLVLNVDMLSQSVSVDIPHDLLEKIDGPSYAHDQLVYSGL